MMRRILPVMLLAAALGGCSSMSSIADQLPLVSPMPTEKVAPLDLLTRMQLPAYVHTVQDAVDYLLEPSGYHLVTSCAQCPPEGLEIARKPISPLGLNQQITTIKRAVLLVSGSGVHLLVDDDAKQVAFSYASKS
jgi:hypothetical protein